MSSGLINLGTVGSATITVTHTPTGFTTTVPVTVTANVLNHLTLTLSSTSGTAGGTAPTLTTRKWADAAETTPSTSTTNYGYTTSNPAVASVDSTAGTIILIGAGTCTFTVTDSISGKSASTATLTVASGTTPSLPNPTGLGFVGDDYTTYANQAQYLANVTSNIGGTGNPATALYNDGFNPTWCSPDFTVMYNGHQTLQYMFPGGTAARPELYINFAGRSNIWFRAMIRFVPGFTTHGNDPSNGNPGPSDAYKILAWQLNTNLYNGSGRIEITNTTEYQCYWGCSNKNTSAVVINTDTSGRSLGQVTSEWQDGLWYQYVFNYYVQGTTSYCNTYFGKMSATPTLRSQASAPNLDGLSAPGATGVSCGLNYNRVRGTNQVLYLNYGFWECVDGGQYPNPFGVTLP